MIKQRVFTAEERQKARSEVIWRDGYRCIFCLRQANAVHHIVPKSRGISDEVLWSLENMACLCLSCHDVAQNRAARTQALEVLKHRHGYNYSVPPWCEYMK